MLLLAVVCTSQLVWDRIPSSLTEVAGASLTELRRTCQKFSIQSLPKVLFLSSAPFAREPERSGSLTTVNWIHICSQDLWSTSPSSQLADSAMLSSSIRPGRLCCCLQLFLHATLWVWIYYILVLDMERASLTDVTKACQDSSNYSDSRRPPAPSLPSRAFQMLDGAKKSLHRLSLHGSSDDFACVFASDTNFCFQG